MGMQRGSITLFAAVILLPILFFLLTLTLDLSEFYANRATMQRLIDEAALHAYRFLPLKDKAREAVNGYLRELNSARGEFESIISSDSVEIIYHGVAPFTFATFAGKKAGIPYDLSTRARGSVNHVALMINSGERLAPAPGAPLWGADGIWPEARLFTHFQPFGPQVSARQATQYCHNPVFSGLKRSALRIFDYLSSFSKNSVAVSFFPGTLASIDIIKDARRPGLEPSNISPGYFNISNSAYSRNSFCLALQEEEPLGSPYQLLPPFAPPESWFPPGMRLTDPETHLVNDTSLPDITLREVIWSRGIRPGIPSARELFSQITQVLAEGGRLNSYEKDNRLAELPSKVGIILTDDLPVEADERFPGQGVKAVLQDELKRFVLMFGIGEEDTPAKRGLGQIYYVVMKTPGTAVASAEIAALQDFFNETIAALKAEDALAIRVVFSDDPEGIAEGVVRSLVLENNTAVIDG